MLEDCGLSEINYSGDKFTGFNKRRGDCLIFEHLDRYLCSGDWKAIYPNASVMNLEFYGSDHRLILINLCPDNLNGIRKSAKRFYFEHKWFLDENFSHFLHHCWNSGGRSLEIPEKLRYCQREITNCAGNCFDNLAKKISCLRGKLNKLLHSNLVWDNFDRISDLEQEIERLSNKEELHWKQRAIANWLNHGDRNTTFFHAFASDRKRNNQIQGMQSVHGVWCTEDAEMAEIIIQYFDSLFSSSHLSSQILDEAISFIETIVSSYINAILEALFSPEVARKAVFDLHPSKAPGQYGFTSLFFQKTWPFIGDEITEPVLKILNGQGDITGWNSTLIMLIPKKDNPQTPMDFRPISLCNTGYNIVLRDITNRLRSILS